MRALRPGEADGLVYVSDAMVPVVSRTAANALGLTTLPRCWRASTRWWTEMARHRAPGATRAGSTGGSRR